MSQTEYGGGRYRLVTNIKIRSRNTPFNGHPIQIHSKPSAVVNFRYRSLSDDKPIKCTYRKHINFDDLYVLEMDNWTTVS